VIGGVLKPAMEDSGLSVSQARPDVPRSRLEESISEPDNSDDQRSPVILKTLLLLTALTIVGGVVVRLVLVKR
jgi:hypothetical protein